MTKRKKNGSRRPSRLDRIERKCDRILAELIAMRRHHASPIDDAIDRLHIAARRMRELCETECEEVWRNTMRR